MGGADNKTTELTVRQKEKKIAAAHSPGKAKREQKDRGS